jgi:hypothetical protein
MATTYLGGISKNASSFAGGVTGVTGVGKQVTIQITGTVEQGDKRNIKLGDRNFGYVNKPIGPATYVMTYNKKVYAIADTMLWFSAVNDANNWDSEYGIGAGFINMFNEFTGGEKLMALAPYAGKLAIFARRTIQIWAMDVDPARNTQVQILDNIGTIASKSVTQVGDVDVFFLADSGIRSLRSRDINNIAFSSDVGNPIDEIIVNKIRELGPTNAAKAIGLIEPQDGRYWLILGDTIYVFSHFTGSSVSAWSTYKPGFTIIGAAVLNGRVWVEDEAGNLYLYGGDDNNTYDDCEVVGEIPFLSAGGPQTQKCFTGFDAICEGSWKFELGTNPETPDEREVIGELWAPSFDMLRIPVNATGTHFSVRFTRQQAAYGRLSNMTVHYTANEAG